MIRAGWASLLHSGYIAKPLAVNCRASQKRAGRAQMGATVYLYNRYDDWCARASATNKAVSRLTHWLRTLYSIRVILASFVPAKRRNIAVLPGSGESLDVSPTGVLRGIGVTFSPVAGTLMTDDWKWVLRTSQATRQVCGSCRNWGRLGEH